MCLEVSWKAAVWNWIHRSSISNTPQCQATPKSMIWNPSTWNCCNIVNIERVAVWYCILNREVGSYESDGWAGDSRDKFKIHMYCTGVIFCVRCCSKFSTLTLLSRFCFMFMRGEAAWCYWFFSNSRHCVSVLCVFNTWMCSGEIALNAVYS